MKSKKRSASRRPPPDYPIIFIDECVDTDSLASALVQAGVAVERHRDHYPQGALDTEWIGEVSQRGWVILTADSRQRRNCLEVIALVEGPAREFVLRHKNLTGAEMAEVVVKHLKRISNIARDQRPPFVARISRSGVELLDSARALRDRLQETDKDASPSDEVGPGAGEREV